MVDLETIVIIGNTLVVGATFIATLYRIKIERDQIKVIREDVKAKDCLNKLRKYVSAERESLATMDRKELKEFLEYLQKLGE